MTFVNKFNYGYQRQAYKFNRRHSQVNLNFTFILHFHKHNFVKDIKLQITQKNI